MATFQQIKQATYQKLWQPSDSTNYNTTLVGNKINSVVSRICRWTVVNLTNQQRYSAGDLSFLRREKTFDALWSLTMTDEYTVWGTIISIDAVDMPSTWKILVGTEIATYTGKTSTTLTGVSGLTLDHTTQEKVYLLYDMPSWISLPFNIFQIDKNGEKGQEVPYQDSRNQDKYYRYFTIITTNNTNYLHIKWYEEWRYMMVYYVDSTDMSANGDTCIIPSPYDIDMLSCISAWELLRENEETDDATPKLIEWYSLLDEMYSFYANMTKKAIRTISPRPVTFSSTIWWYGTKRSSYTIR